MSFIDLSLIKIVLQMVPTKGLTTKTQLGYKQTGARNWECRIKTAFDSIVSTKTRNDFIILCSFFVGGTLHSSIQCNVISKISVFKVQKYPFMHTKGQF